MGKKKTDPRIKSYTNAKGETLYKFQIYVGVDEYTGKKKNTTRRGFRTITEAHTELKKLEYEIKHRGYELKNKRMKFKELFFIWFDSYSPTVAGSTAKNRLDTYKAAICDYFSEIYIDKMDRKLFETFFRDFDGSLGYKTTIKTTLNLVFNFAIENGYIEKNPIERVKIDNTKTKNFKEIKFYSKNEILHLLEFIQPINHTLYVTFYTLIFTGIRVGELLALEWNDIDYKNKTLNISKILTVDINGNHTINKGKTLSSIRTIPLTDENLRLLNSLRGNTIYLNGSNRIFNFTKAYLRKKLRQLTKKCGIEYKNIHSLRHTHATLMLEAGVSLETISSRLGHSTLTTTTIYAEVTEKKQRESIDIFNSYMNGSQYGSQ